NEHVGACPTHKISCHAYDTITNSIDRSQNIHTVVYKKYNISAEVFPSTDRIHDRYHVDKCVVRVSNRIYLNLEAQLRCKHWEFRIYINYNHNSKAEINVNTIKLRETIEMFKLL